MIVFGLTGGIASGKSFVASLFAERGAVVIDADRHAHAVLAEPEVIDALRRRWGDAVVGDDGGLRRREVARRVFGEDQKPNDGFVLDEVGSMPQAYLRGGEPSDFEREIWSQVWEFANDREKAAAKGIRAAHGEAPSIKAKPGQVYQISLRASGGLSITLQEAAKATEQSQQADQ